jgi:hypothetical protein
MMEWNRNRPLGLILDEEGEECTSCSHAVTTDIVVHGVLFEVVDETAPHSSFMRCSCEGE